MKTAKLMAIMCVAGLCAFGCHKDNKMQASPGTVGAKSECCEKAAKDGNMGAVGAKKDGCCAEKAKANMGAVGAKSGTCSEKAATCTEKTKANMGAVGEKTGTCTEKAVDGNMGAVSTKKASGCCAAKKTN